MQDLFQNYVSDLNKLRDAFHEELTATATDLSKAVGDYSRCSEAALISSMAKVSGRGEGLEAAAAARLDQFRGLPAVLPAEISQARRPALIDSRIMTRSRAGNVECETRRSMRLSMGGVITSDALVTEGALVFAKACELGLEGIVSKRVASQYSSGSSRQWLKSKNPEFERA
jgi:hypothetical protein